MGEPRHTFRGPVALWGAAKSQAEEHGDVLSDVLRAALSLYARDRDGYWQAVTPPSLDGPAVPSFSHTAAPVKPWRWERPLGHERA